MKAYIAGKITGDPDYWHKFQRAQEDLEDQGFTVINPAELPEGMRPAGFAGWLPRFRWTPAR